MKWTRPASIGKTVEARASNRPIKIAYLVPNDNEELTHTILDAAFSESYTRWGGVYTVIIPTKRDSFAIAGYDDWLSQYDPDFVYSYVDLAPEFIELIDRLFCPIALLKHELLEQDNSRLSWRSYMPRWTHYVQAVPSISTVQSPESYPQLNHENRPPEPTILVEYGSGPFTRFLADNFGVGFSTHHSPNPIPGLFRTLCLTPENIPENHFAGTERCSTQSQAFQAICDRKVTPIARLAMIHSSGIGRTESLDWAFAFRLIVGTSAQDRINFWNSRLLGNSWNETSNALIVEASFFDDDDSVVQLGHYLNKHNFLGHGSGPYQVRLHSASESMEVLEGITKKLQARTFNSVGISENPDGPAIPTAQDLTNRTFTGGTADRSVLKLTEDYSDIVAEEPAHFTYLSPQRKSIAEGQWIVELDIDRHHNLSKLSNVVDTWMLPKRRRITRAFTDRLAKPTRTGALALLPSCESLPIRRQAIRRTCKYELSLPSDETFFRHLALNFFKYPIDDLRSGVPSAGYVDIATSDKGQNLRGVISMFGSLSEAYEILTKKYWRTVLDSAKEDKVRPLHFELDRLTSLLPGDRRTLQLLAEELNYEKGGAAKKYLEAGLLDTLEYLVKLNVFFQVAHWRCRYCGHLNARSFDNMKIKNECEICATMFYAPIDLKWQYELNGFVYRSLSKQAGLPVLWTLGYLHDNTYLGSFWYLPEVDLFDDPTNDKSKNEIDILCVIGGVFHAIEVKTTASLFVNKPGSVEKFVKIVERLRPDVAMLSFAKYCSDEMQDKTEEVKLALTEATKEIREKIGPLVQLKILVAEDHADFNAISPDLGTFGSRLRALNS